MIQSFTLENFGPIQCIEAKNLGKVNLILAENSKGKTFILKALYSVIKSHEEAHKGKNNRSFQEELSNKLYWAFQIDNINHLISKPYINPESNPLELAITLDGKVINLSLDSNKEEICIENELVKRDTNSIFIPPKEVLSLFNIIKTSAYDNLFGFDITYIDLAKALDSRVFNSIELNDEEINTIKQINDVLPALEKQLNQLLKINEHIQFIDNNEMKQQLQELETNKNNFNQVMNYLNESKNEQLSLNQDIQSIVDKLKDIFGGKVKFHSDRNEWIYTKDKHSFTMNVTAEGIKKIAILETLLQNGFLTSNSIIFIDEPESNLHPKAISQFLDILFELSQAGMQIFMATHSYFVIKKMHLLAQQHKESVPVLMSKDEDGKTIWIQENLIDGMPENEIINESIRLFEEELGI